MKTIKSAILALLISLSGAASADELLAMSHYGNELNRCVAQIRLSLDAGANTPLHHQVTQVRKDGAWYRFVIETRNAQQTVISACKANRFSTDTRVTFNQPAAAQSRLASTN